MSSSRLLAIAFFVLAADPAYAVDHRVPEDHPNIQAALDAAQDGDRVLVGPGRYFEALRFPARSVQMLSTNGPLTTIVDAGQAGTVVTFEGSPGRGTILEGFTLTNGLDPARQQAGGVHMGQGASATVRNNVIRQNWGYGAGHGMSLVYPRSPLIVGNEIRHNRSGPGQTGGGGGGGIGIRGSACAASEPDCGVEVRNNYIGNNYVTGYSSGGGLYLDGAAAAVIHNVIEFNTTADNGGGLSSVNGSNALIENNLFRSNVAGHSGGAIQWSVSFEGDPVQLLSNTLVENQAPNGSAIAMSGWDGTSRLVNNLVSTTAVGAALFCWLGADNQVPQIRHNLVHAPQGTAIGGACATALGSNGNHTAAPFFEGEADFRLRLHSPGVDMGDGSASGQIFDLDGRPRISDGDGDGVAVMDIGAYEWHTSVLFSDGFENRP